MPAHQLRPSSNVSLPSIFGLGIGCLVGVSVSPVLAVVVASLLAAAASVLSDIRKSETGRSLNIALVFVLILGIVAGSVVGVLTRDDATGVVKESPVTIRDVRATFSPAPCTPRTAPRTSSPDTAPPA